MLPLSIIWMIRKNKYFYVSMCSLSSSWVVVYWTAGKFQGTPLYIFTECILRGLCHINSRSDYDGYNVDGMVRLITFWKPSNNKHRKLLKKLLGKISEMRTTGGCTMGVCLVDLCVWWSIWSAHVFLIWYEIWWYGGVVVCVPVSVCLYVSRLNVLVLYNMMHCFQGKLGGFLCLSLTPLTTLLEANKPGWFNLMQAHRHTQTYLYLTINYTYINCSLSTTSFSCLMTDPESHTRIFHW